MKKTYAIILALVLVLAMVPTVAFADGTVNTAADLTAALSAGGNVVLGADINAGNLNGGSFFTVSGGKTVTLDLNGHTLQGTRDNSGSNKDNTTSARNTAIIRNGGTLTIKDSAGGGQIVINATDDSGWNSNTAAVSNGGTLTVQSGTLLNNGGTSMAFAIDSLSSPNVLVTVTGGTLKSVNYVAIRQFANSTSATNTVNVQGGTIYGYKRGIWIQQPSASNGLATLNISGGTIEAGLQSAVLADLMGTDGVDIYVTGGKLINHADFNSAANHPSATVGIQYGDDSVTSAGGAYVKIAGGCLFNSGTGGNLANYTTAGVAAPSTIEVFSGTFSTTVPTGYIASGADTSQIIMGGNTNTSVSVGVQPTYMIVIPTAVDLGTLVKGTNIVSKDFTVSAMNLVIEDGYKVTVGLTSGNTFVMKDAGGSGSLAFVLKNQAGTAIGAGTSYTDFNADGNNKGSVNVDTSTILKAGSYKGTMDFVISYGK